MKALIIASALLLPTLAQAGDLGEAQFGYWICLRDSAERHAAAHCGEPDRLADIARATCTAELATVGQVADRQGLHPPTIMETARIGGTGKVEEVLAEFRRERLLVAQRRPNRRSRSASLSST